MMHSETVSPKNHVIMNEELKNRIEEWHETDHHQEIIDALERIPAAKRDYDTTGLLARAYNNSGEYDKAAKALETVRKKGEKDALWNYRMGYSQYFLDNYQEALGYLNKAHALDPDDADTIQLIRLCNVKMPLTGRVEEFWNWFVKNEKKLSGMVNPETHEDAEELMAFVHEGTSLISENIYYNLGGDHKFTFSVEGCPDLFIIYPYIISRMPESLKPKWKFFPFNNGTDKAFGFSMYGADINTDHIMVRASYLEDSDCFNITYCDKNLGTLTKNESDIAMWIILESTLGEGVSYKYIDEIERVSKPQKDMIPLPELKGHIRKILEDHSRQLFENPKEVYSGYSMEPQKSDELRYDVITGFTCLSPIVADYYDDSAEIFDHINSFGAQAVYIAIQNPDDTELSSILNLRHEIEDRLTAEILGPMNRGQVTGGATGTNCSYIDLIVYDLPGFIDAVKPLLSQYPQYSFYLSEFRRHAGLKLLTEAVSSSSGNKE